MKFKILLFTAAFLTIAASLFAKPLVDSVGVENHNGKKVILFKVKAKDTYYSIGRRYGVSPKEIMAYNDTKKETLSIGKTIKVPTDMPFKSPKAIVKAKKKTGKKHQEEEEEPETTVEERPEQPEVKETPKQEMPERPEIKQPEKAAQPEQTAPNNDTQVLTQQYKVSAGETLYAIAKRFNTTVDNITKINSLTSTTLTPGQILIVKTGTPPPPAVAAPATPAYDQPVVAKRDSTFVAPVPDSSDADRRVNNPTHFGLFEKTEKGVATWIEDTTLDPNKKLVLHRTAPIGTVVKITNPMTNRTTFAKVVGRFTDNESTKDVIVVMTKNVANALGAIDKRFHVDISYGTPNE